MNCCEDKTIENSDVTLIWTVGMIKQYNNSDVALIWTVGKIKQ